MNYKGETNENPDLLLNGLWVRRLLYGSVKGRIRFDQIEGLEFIQKHRFHKLKIEELGGKKKIIYVHINGENVEEVDMDYVKHFIISFLIYNASEALGNYLLDNNIFIAPDLLDRLRERIPYDAIEDRELIFHVDEGIICVTKNRMLMAYVKVIED